MMEREKTDTTYSNTILHPIYTIHHSYCIYMFTFSLLLLEERGLSTLASSPSEGFPCSISLSFHCIHIYLGRFLSPLHDVSRFGDCKMSTVDNPHIADTESEDRRRPRRQRRRRNPSVARSSDQGTEGSLCFSDSDEQSRHSPFGSTAGGSCDDECRFSGESVSQIEGVSDPDRNSLSSDVDLESGILEVKVRLAEGGKRM
ncbi:hypothetical protein L1049_013011 [Liquidambar formosana]|uniref:Uncharacterized protein n=1 Tax=Liquidambar formosana TaxID=63359 RepID=A0AAP0RLS8_LIQFO